MRLRHADGDGDVLVVHQRRPAPATAAATSDPFTLDAAGVADGTAFTQTPDVSGSFAFQATYSGDGTYDRFDGRV